MEIFGIVLEVPEISILVAATLSGLKAWGTIKKIMRKGYQQLPQILESETKAIKEQLEQKYKDQADQLRSEWNELKQENENLKHQVNEIKSILGEVLDD